MGPISLLDEEPANVQLGAAQTAALAHLGAALAALTGAGLPPSSADPVINHAAAAQWLGIGERTLHRLCARHDGPPRVRLSRRRIGYRPSALREWAAQREAHGDGVR